MHNNNIYECAVPAVRKLWGDSDSQMGSVCKKLLHIGFSSCLAFCGLSSGVAHADEAYFNEHVLPQLAKNACAVCHTGQYIRPRVFEYRELLPYIAMGTARDNNVLIAKMTNARPFLPDVASHPGGQKCASKDVEPCLTFMKWWDEEFAK